MVANPSGLILDLAIFEFTRRDHFPGRLFCDKNFCSLGSVTFALSKQFFSYLKSSRFKMVSTNNEGTVSGWNEGLPLVGEVLIGRLLGIANIEKWKAIAVEAYIDQFKAAHRGDGCRRDVSGSSFAAKIDQRNNERDQYGKRVSMTHSV